MAGLRRRPRNQRLSDAKLALEVQLERQSLRNATTEFRAIYTETEREVVQRLRSIHGAKPAGKRGKMAGGVEKDIALLVENS